MKVTYFRQMEFRIIILYGIDIFLDLNHGIQFFFYGDIYTVGYNKEKDC